MQRSIWSHNAYRYDRSAKHNYYAFPNARFSLLTNTKSNYQRTNSTQAHQSQHESVNMLCTVCLTSTISQCWSGFTKDARILFYNYARWHGQWRQYQRHISKRDRCPVIFSCSMMSDQWYSAAVFSTPRDLLLKWIRSQLATDDSALSHPLFIIFLLFNSWRRHHIHVFRLLGNQDCQKTTWNHGNAEAKPYFMKQKLSLLYLLCSYVSPDIMIINPLAFHIAWVYNNWKMNRFISIYAAAWFDNQYRQSQQDIEL